MFNLVQNRHFSLISALITPKILVASWRQEIYSYGGVFFSAHFSRHVPKKKRCAIWHIFKYISVRS